MKKVALAMLLAVSALAQDAKPELKLTELETLKWEKIQLLAERLNAQFKVKEYNEAMGELNKQLADLNGKVLADRKLDAKEYQVNWQAGIAEAVKKPVEAAKR